MGSKAKEVTTEDQILAEILKEIAEKSEISRLSIVNGTSISKSRLYDLLDGKKPFYMDDVKQICSLLGVAYWKVMEDVESRLASASNVLQFPPKTLEDLGITDEDILKRAAAHKTTTPIHAEYDQHHWEE